MGSNLFGARFEGVVLDVLSHPRYRGDYMPVWRIADAGALPLHPVAIHWSLKRLERQGRVEHRRLATGQMEWRTLVRSDGS
jgi:hypothetical protein